MDEGNVAGMIELPAGASSAQLALGFGDGRHRHRGRHRSALRAVRGTLERFAVGWRKAQDHLLAADSAGGSESCSTVRPWRSSAATRTGRPRARSSRVCRSRGATERRSGRLSPRLVARPRRSGRRLARHRRYRERCASLRVPGLDPGDRWLLAPEPVDRRERLLGGQSARRDGLPGHARSALRDAGALDATADRPPLLDPRRSPASFVGPSPSWCGPAGQPARIAGRKTLGSRYRRWRRSSPPWSRVPTFFREPAAAGILEVADDGTPRSSAGRTPRTRP